MKAGWMRKRGRISGKALVAVIGLAGCTAPAPPNSEHGKPPGADSAVAAAYFAEDPAALHAAAEAACDAPAETFVRPGPGVVQCRMLMPPDLTAAVILSYDGVVEPLPQLVISLAKARAGDGHVVAGCTFVRLQRADGRMARILQNDPRIQARIHALLKKMGGKPLRNVPAEAVARCLSL